MKDAYSFDVSDAGLDASYQRQRDAYERIFTRLGLDYVIVKADAGAMGGSKSEEFLHPTPVGEDTFVRTEGGYAANVEAYETPRAEPLPLEGRPEARVFDSPDTPTIATLVDLLNERHPRDDGRVWEAADTLKNVVLALKHLDGTRETVVVAVPGDRDVDMKRIEVAFAPSEVEAATDADFAAHPALVKGYIGPWSASGAVLGEDSASGIRYVADPRVVEGSSWVTGANAAEKHVLGLTVGRDFTVDATIEAATIREGDPAPDGSGPVHLARGTEIGHVFQLGRKYAEALGLQVLDENGKLVTVTMGSYGLGITRDLALLAELHNDDKGLCWPRNIAPFDVHVIATGKDAAIYDAAERISDELEAQRLEVLYDDRPKVSPGVKFGDAELIGVPTIVIAGRGIADGLVELWDRRSGERTQVPLSEITARILDDR